MVPWPKRTLYLKLKSLIGKQMKKKWLVWLKMQVRPAFRLSLEHLHSGFLLGCVCVCVNSCGQNLPEYKAISRDETTQKELYFPINLFIGFSERQPDGGNLLS